MAVENSACGRVLWSTEMQLRDQLGKKDCSLRDH